MRKGPLAGGFAISTVLLLGVLFSSSAFADAGGKGTHEMGIDGTGAQGPMRPFGSR
jgi:hypothetical protein